jgi:hypothetical protein
MPGYPKRARTITTSGHPANLGTTMTTRDRARFAGTHRRMTLHADFDMSRGATADPTRNRRDPGESSQGLKSVFSFFFTATPLIVT